MNTFLSALHHISPLSPDAQQNLSDSISTHQLPKNTLLLQPGNVARHFYFVEKGLARVFYYYNELDVTDYFAIENQFIGGVESLFTGQPSKKGIQLIEDSVVHSIAGQDLEKLCAEYHEIERCGRKLAVFAFLEGQQRIESIRFHDAKQRYNELLLKYPGLINRCPLKYIASYLGINQASLSRLRAEI